MTLSRPRLVLLPGESPMDASLVESLRSMFDVIELPNAAAAQRIASEEPGTLVLAPGDQLHVGQPRSPQAAVSILQYIGEGVGLVDASGSIAWMNSRLQEYEEPVRQHFAQLCRQAIQVLNESHDSAIPVGRRRSKKFSFRSGEEHYELVASPASVEETDADTVATVVGVMWEVTASRRLLDKLDAIDAAGSELMKIEAGSIVQLNMAQRLKVLEEKIVHYVHDLLQFDNFEIRLLDKETNRLELVTSVGITPEKIGEVIHPQPQGSGITGYVAATGESYLCPNVKEDPLYREGLDHAASSLTVPLRLHDRVIGVFNIESKSPAAFDHNDRQFATIFGRYIAMAMNILDLLVVERYTTNEQMAQNVLSELNEPLAEVTNHARELREANLADGKTRKGLEQIIEDIAGLRKRIEACTAAPRSVLGAEEELHRSQPDPSMTGKRVLIADDDPIICTSVSKILTQKGCEVTACRDGNETIEALRSAQSCNTSFDLVISDIKMPLASGYEVFRTSKELAPDTPVILMTGFGYDPHHSIVRASQEGLHSFLFKPFKAGQLVEEVKKALSTSVKAGS
ncbi:MAG: response regulator [Planctomycetota bacterium]|nr:response regulator [Planctomycetota bacterium]